MKKTRIIIAGTRYYKNQGFVNNRISWIIRKMNHENIEFVEGGEPTGIDRRGREFAIEHEFPYTTFEADWGTHGKAAGPIRNREMASYGTHLIAFWDGKSRGTKNMIEEAKKKGLKMIIVRLDKEK